jgi:hypothetical protein
MSISVNPILPVFATQGVAPDLVLQPGSVVDAQVLQLLSDDLVQIAIAGLSINVASEVPLSAGQRLQLAVSQNESGIRLAIVAPQVNASTATSADTVTLAPEATINGTASSAIDASALKGLLTPLERLAVTAAAQSAAPQQDSLAPLFANLEAVISSNSLIPKLQQAVAQMLAQRTDLDQNLDGAAIKGAFEKSGIFLEASLASASPLPASGVPDLKAALLVLRQTIMSSLGADNTSGTATPAGLVPPTAPLELVNAAANTASSSNPALMLRSGSQADENAKLAPPLAPEIELREVLLPQARAVTEQATGSSGNIRIVTAESLPNAAQRLIAAGTTLNLLQEQAGLRADLLRANADPVADLLALGATKAAAGEPTTRSNTPPPPFRGALPSAQPIASASIGLDAPLATKAHHLLGDTDAALARQTLLQVASLPDRVDSATRTDPTPARWNFEIPFATPQGTAVAQFEISRDRTNSETEAVKRVWRARFSLDVEPAGPVHALVSLSGERTSVRIWAERSSTAAKLRAGAAQLSQALSNAELQPGDIVIQDGAPLRPAPPRAGHFMDRAL